MVLNSACFFTTAMIDNFRGKIDAFGYSVYKMHRYTFSKIRVNKIEPEIEVRLSLNLNYNKVYITIKTR